MNIKRFRTNKWKDCDGDARITAEEGEMAEFALKKARGEL